ncbi:MFS transporter [Aquiflexum lacus]|uniref:MFS transporter n=1 Tax=Aquiflexum lacus TaxID=2483805 RepID=UPI00189543F8|nr:MFS transporter [Aquiflexum lacus]
MKNVLPIIVLCQFLCTSIWFAGNSVLPDLIFELNLDQTYLGNLTSAVQLGFITGTLVFAVFTISDKFSPSRVFLICSIFGSSFNFMVSLDGMNAIDILIFRFMTGFFLAGIYPVGMKIAADYFQKGLGKSLGLLVGALVLGTSFPHLVKSVTDGLPWKTVLYTTSFFALVGGILLFSLVPDGPFRKPGRKFHFSAFLSVFRIRAFRAAAFGYFGHMWELYAFWAFIPFILQSFATLHGTNFNIPLWSFIIIAVGGISCALGGVLSEKFNPKYIASFALGLSGICCLLSPIFLLQPFSELLLLFLLIWGLSITADSPMFSTLVAQNSPDTARGTALTIVNCLGFAITIISIQALSLLSELIDVQYLFLILALGPFFGLIAMVKLRFLNPSI